MRECFSTVSCLKKEKKKTNDFNPPGRATEQAALLRRERREMRTRWFFEKEKREKGNEAV